MTSKRKPSKKRDPNAIKAPGHSGEDDALVMARAVLRPTVQAAVTLKAYASLIAGHYIHLAPTKKAGKAYGNVSLAVWSVRILVDAGIVKPAEVLLPPCPDLRKSVKQFYTGVKLLFQVRWAFKDHKNGPVPMGRNFMSAWTGLSEDQCRDAIIALLKVGVIYTAGQHGRARLFAPGPGYNSNS